MMNEKQTATRLKKVAKQNLDWREKFWPEIKDEDLWLRKSKVGFITVPRGLPQIMAFIDALTKNTPASKTYFALWCRSFDEMVIRIQNPMILASESGFSGPRQLTTWNARMELLEKFGFIKTAKGPTGPYEFIMLLNPYVVIKKYMSDPANTINENLRDLFLALEIRASEIGADDLLG
jgi:hypothetical protein